MKRQRKPTASPDHKPAPVSAPAASSTTTAPDKPLDALARSQEGLPSAEAFWKSAGRFCRLR